jgi:hypothetical protein
MTYCTSIVPETMSSAVPFAGSSASNAYEVPTGLVLVEGDCRNVGTSGQPAQCYTALCDDVRAA